MFSKEEIEKAKEKTKEWSYNMRTGRRVNIIHKGDKDFCNDLETLLQYIEQLEEINNEMVEYLAIIRDCPNEDKGANLDCENRCTYDDNIYAECWKLYFQRKVNKGNE